MAITKTDKMIMDLMSSVAAINASMLEIKEKINEQGTDLKKMTHNNEKMYHTIYGNGQKGLVQKQDEIIDKLNIFERNKERVKGGFIVINSIFGFIAGLLAYFTGGTIK